MLRLAVVGLGRRATSMIKALQVVEPEVSITGMVDPSPGDVRKRLEEAKIPANNILVMDTPASIIRKRDQFDGVFIGTRCHLHAPIATELAQADLPLFLEKPVAITQAQLEALATAYQGKEDRVVVSFPLRATPLFAAVLEIIQSGRLGTINQIQAVNNVPYGDGYFKSWYRSFSESGGLWLQKATHDVDYINHLAGCRPQTVAAMISRQVYDDVATSIEMTNAAPSKPRKDGRITPDEPVRLQDAGSALLMYENGLHASYSQNFVTRNSAGKRGAIVTGHKATLEFDWYTSRIIVTDHFKQRVDNIDIKIDDEGHGGGDYTLLKNFANLMRGTETSISSLTEGLRSAAICLAARESCNTHTFVPVNMPGEPMPAQGPHAREDINQYQRSAS